MLFFSQCVIFHNYCTIDITPMFAAYPQHIHTVLFTITLQFTGFAVYICFPFHNVIFFLIYWIIYSTTVFTAYPQHMHTVLFTITLPSILTLLFIYASFTQCDIFSQLLHNWLYNNVYSISATYTYSIVYNYSPQYTDFAVYICFLYTMWHFFTITAQLTLQQCLQHILNIYIRYCLQLHYPVYWLCCLYILPLHNVTFFHNYCTIDSTTMSTAYPQHIHIVLFTTTLQCILALLFIYAFLFTMWYFFTITAQFTLQQCLQHILNIYIQYYLQLHYPVH